jgi:hypothetical protein
MAKQTVFEQYQRDTAAFIDQIKVNENWCAYFKKALKLWHKAHGTPCTPQQLTLAVMLTSNNHTPGIECLSTAMSLRNEGYLEAQYTSLATTADLKGTGVPVGPANNKRRALIKAGYIDEVVIGKPANRQVALTPKGIRAMQAAFGSAELKAAGAAVEAPKATAKAKGKPKAKKPTPQPTAETPTSEAPSATEGQHVVVDEITNQQPAEVELGGVDAAHDEVTQTELQSLAAHFNQA